MMPVIECSCGMVMSVPIEAQRGSCIRCGGVEFHILDRSTMDVARRNRIFQTCAAPFGPPPIHFVGLSVAVDNRAESFAEAIPLELTLGKKIDSRGREPIPQPRYAS
jgi:hypothetical protein